MNELIADRFEVLRPLGSGGASDVSLVRDRRDGSTSALKRLRLGDGESLERFQAEFAELAALRHPNIVRVDEYGALDDGGRWILMEAVEGRPADQAVRPGDISGALRLVLDAIAGIDALHAAGRFHGDLKPSNILAGGPRAVLVDFGFMGRDREMPGGRKRGTPGYLAPEVLDGRASYGRASDAYALGATLYRVLSGRPAFHGRDAAAILSAQARGAPSMQPLENAGVPHALADLVIQLLAEDPDARVAALEELRDLARRRVGGEDGARSHAVLATSGPLVGRDAERERLRAHLLGAGGGLRIALVAGPVGSGRTRMAHELAIDAELRSWTLEWHDAKSTPAASDAGAGGTLLVLDDVDEWPDRALEALRPVLDADRPTAILATARSPRLEGQPFLRWSLGVSEDIAPHVFELGALGPEACAELVRARLGGAVPLEVIEAIARETSRLPGAIAAVVARLVESGALRQSASEWTLAPGEAAEAAVRAAAAVAAGATDAAAGWSQDSRRVLVAIAGSADPVDAGRVAALTGLGADVVASTIEELDWRGLLARADGGLHVVPPAMERIALERLEGDDVSPVRARLIEELSRGAGAADARRLRLVGSHAWARGERATAWSAWQSAWDARRAGDRDEIAELTRAVEEREFGAGDGAGGGEAAARLLAAIAEHWQAVNRPAIAERLWQRAAETWPAAAKRTESDVFLARCDLERARCLFGLTRHADGLAALDRLFERDAAATSLPAELRGEALTERGWGRAMLGQAAEARADWEEALRVLPESSVAARVVALHRFASFQNQWGDYDAARLHLASALDMSTELGVNVLTARVRANLAQLAANEGRYEDARNEYLAVLDSTPEIAGEFWYPILLTNLCTIHAQLGDWSAWERTLQTTIALARSAGDVALLCALLASRQTLEIRRGNLPSAMRALRAEREWLRFSSRQDQHAHHRITLGVIHGLLNHERTAHRILAQAHGTAAARRSPMNVAQSALALGDLFLRASRLKLAAEWYRRADASQFKGHNLSTLSRLGRLRIALRRRSVPDVTAAARDLELALAEAPPLETPAIRSEIAAVRAAIEANDFVAAQEYQAAVRALEERGLVLRAIETAWEASRNTLSMGRQAMAQDFVQEAWRLAESTRLEAWKACIAVELAFRRTSEVNGESRDASLAPTSRELLARVAELMNSLLDYPVLIQSSLALVAKHLDADRGYILLVDKDTKEIRTVGRYGAVDEESQENALNFSRSIVRRVATSGEVFHADDAATDPRLGSTQSVLDLAVRSVVCTPLRIKDELIGTVYLESRSSAAQFTERDLEQLEAFSNLVALAIDSNRKYEELRRSRARVMKTNLSLRKDAETKFQPSNIVGQSVEIERVLDEIELIANSRGTVLITGESGTGKELIAKTIHYNSPRSENAFLSLNCAALPTDLIEAELFGIESHAATGVQGRPGIFERANEGTLFLDEIGDMPVGLQTKLLRVLQEREFVRVGTTGRVVKVDVRLIAATNQDLAQMIRDGRFREDLYFRLHALPIHIAPLRERKADIIPLAEHFLVRFCEENGRPLPALSAEFKAALHRHNWPGNVRELQHYIERAVVMSLGPTLKPIGFMPDLGIAGAGAAPSQTPPSRTDLKPGETLKFAIEEFEGRVILRALEHADWNQRQAARALGLVEPTLRYKMARLGIEPPPQPKKR